MSLNEINFALGPEKMLTTLSDRYADRNFFTLSCISQQRWLFAR